GHLPVGSARPGQAAQDVVPAREPVRGPAPDHPPLLISPVKIGPVSGPGEDQDALTRQAPGPGGKRYCPEWAGRCAFCLVRVPLSGRVPAHDQAPPEPGYSNRSQPGTINRARIERVPSSLAGTYPSRSNSVIT